MLPKKKGKRAGLPKRVDLYVHLVYLYIRAQGVGGGHNTRIEFAVLFCSAGSSFLTQVRQVKVVFLRTLRNAATCLLIDLIVMKTLLTARLPVAVSSVQTWP